MVELDDRSDSNELAFAANCARNTLLHSDIFSTSDEDKDLLRSLNIPTASQERDAIDQILQAVANDGTCRHPWEFVKVLCILRLYRKLWEFRKSSDSPIDTRSDVSYTKRVIRTAPDDDADDEILNKTYVMFIKDVVARLFAFEKPPFTLQRMCELLLLPSTEMYRGHVKWSFALQRSLIPVSYQDDEASDSDNHTGSEDEEKTVFETLPRGNSTPSIYHSAVEEIGKVTLNISKDMEKEIDVDIINTLKESAESLQAPPPPPPHI
eukprot:GHVO01040037.1.p1 GENE.GHVO01040037.1~~GHVO01040037.1.p1  ORF type:complete len:273 (-),score=60.74 GHVO01040037.1:569-1366(-)